MYLSAIDLAIMNSLDDVKKCQYLSSLKKLNDIEAELNISTKEIRKLSRRAGKLIEENRKFIEELDKSNELD